MKRLLLLAFSILMVFIFSGISEALCVSTPVANLRSGPGTKYKKNWQVYKYMPFRRMSRKGNWYMVRDVDGDEHWIHKKIVTSKIQCAVVKVEKANIRSGPGIDFAKADTSPAIKYDSYKVLKIKGLWVKVLDEYGDKGWIYRKLLWIQ